MTDLTIRTQTFGDRGFLPRRRLETATKKLNTPAKAIPAAKIRQMESLSPKSRKAAELYTQVDSGLLKQTRHQEDDSIFGRLNADAVEDGEVAFAFTSFQDAHTISEVEARQLVNATAVAGEFVTGPLQPTLARAVEPANGLEDPAYQSYYQGAENVLQQAEEYYPHMPRMGVLPMLGQAYIDDLLDLYIEDYGIQAFCLNFDRKKITANRQVSLLQTLARYLTNRDLEEDVIIYAINMNPKDRALMSGVHPAANYAAVGLGVDIVGENHVPPRAPPEVFEGESGTEDEESGDVFRFFDKDAITIREIPLDELRVHWPDDTALDITRVLERSRAGAQGRNRMQAIFNAEQMVLALQTLQNLEDGEVMEYLESREGITPDIIDAFEAVREAFDSGRGQSGLSDFT